MRYEQDEVDDATLAVAALERAQTILDERGWHKGAMVSPTGRVCHNGALLYALEELMVEGVAIQRQYWPNSYIGPAQMIPAFPNATQPGRVFGLINNEARDILTMEHAEWTDGDDVYPSKFNDDIATCPEDIKDLMVLTEKSILQKFA